MTKYDSELERKLRRDLTQKIQQLNNSQSAEYHERLSTLCAHLDAFTVILHNLREHERKLARWNKFQWWHPIWAVFVISVIGFSLTGFLDPPNTYLAVAFLVFLYLTIQHLIYKQTVLHLWLMLKHSNAELARYGESAQGIMHSVAEASYLYANGKLTDHEHLLSDSFRHLKLRYAVLGAVMGAVCAEPSELQQLGYSDNSANIFSPLYDAQRRVHDMKSYLS